MAHPKGTEPAAIGQQSLHALVALKSTRRMKTGATRSILAAAAPLANLGVYLHFVPARSILHFLPALLKRRRVRYDLLLLNGLGSISSESQCGYSLWRIARTLRIPIFLYWHETDWVLDRYEREDPAGARRVSRIAQDPATVHLTASDACSLSIRAHHPAARPIAVYECASVPPPFDQPVPPVEPPVVLGIGTIQERKGTDLFVKTAIEVCRRHPTVEFTWLGDGEPFGSWQADILGASLQERILFPGYVDAGHMILRRASLLFLSSRDDPFPLSVLEAMCLGRSIVAFDVGGAPEALAGHGQLISPFDTGAATAAILECLDKPPAARLDLALRERYLTLFAPERFAQRLNHTIREHLSRD